LHVGDVVGRYEPEDPVDDRLTVRRGHAVLVDSWIIGEYHQFVLNLAPMARMKATIAVS
jgi:hypothetical protein